MAPSSSVGSELKPRSEASTKRQDTPPHQVEVLNLLTGLLEARVEALVTWMDQRQEAVARIADSARNNVASIVRAPSIGDRRSPGAQAPLRLRVSAPAADANGLPDDAQPLTRMAADATRGNDGADWRGYADYRSIEVVGAWKWIPKYEFGVAAEMDRAPSSSHHVEAART